MRKLKKKKKFAATSLASCIAFCSVNSCCPANAVFPKLQAYLFTFSVVRANYYMQLHWSVSLEKKLCFFLTPKRRRTRKTFNRKHWYRLPNVIV